MPNLLTEMLSKATRLTRMGQLMEATELIQRALKKPVPAQPSQQPAANDSVLRLPVPPVQAERPNTEPLVEDSPDLFPETLVQPEVLQPAQFTEGEFSFEGLQYPYRLFVPTRPLASPGKTGTTPLIVLLHGCTQNAEDFALGTDMNALAEQHQCMVLYPEQTSQANVRRCWNWFEPDHQQRGRGEPGMIAAITQQVLDSHPEADASRVYIAGLSAGGAMAALVAGQHPDMFAAVGVHSGLQAGAARDLASAFGAMRHGAPGQASPPLPTIVFHGTADQTVHPDNGQYLSDAAQAAFLASGVSLTERRTDVRAPGEALAERISFDGDGGRSYVEYWRVDAGPHAWSGGKAAGSFTAPDGPAASAAMLAFFLQHRQRSAA